MGNNKVVILSCFLLTSATSVVWPAPPPNANWLHASDDRVGKESIEKLINQFTTSRNDSFAFITMWPTLQFSRLGSEPPETRQTEPVSKLVAIGLPALPVLLDHLTDARPTRLKLETGFLHYWYGNTFDVRPYDRNPKPRGTKRNGQTIGDVHTYKITVGDVCYETLGQIVGRDYIAVERMEGSYSMINSPTHTPAIAAAAKSEWVGLTRQDHIRSLLADTYSNETPAEAIKRVCYYYPTEGKAAALAMLSRPICDYDSASNFLYEQLLEMPTFGEKDILSVKALRQAISHPSNRCQRYLAHAMNAQSSLEVPGQRPVDVVRQLVFLLNHVITQPIYSPKLFAGATLRPETRRMLATHPKGYDLECANRKLLEDVYPYALAKSPAPSRGVDVWKLRLASFVEKNGPAYTDYVWQCLSSLATQHIYDDGPALSQRAARIIHTLYPNRDVAHPRFANAADVRDQNDLMNNLQSFHDPDLEKATDSLLQKMNDLTAVLLRSQQVDVRDESDIQACGWGCISYLNGRGDKQTSINFCLLNIKLVSKQLAQMQPRDEARAGYQGILYKFQSKLNDLEAVK